MIEISGQYGDPRCAPQFFLVQRELNGLFQKYCASDYFFSLEKISIILRVSGAITDFEGDGPEKFKYLKRDAEFTIDLTVPESKWANKNDGDLRQVIKEGLVRCFDVFIEKSVELNELKNKRDFLRDFGLVVNDFSRLN